MTTDPTTFRSAITLRQLRAAFEEGERRNADDQPTHPVYLPPNLYDRAEAEGFNMVGYVKMPLMPTTPGVFAEMTMRPGVYANGSVMTAEVATRQYSRMPLNYVGAQSGPRFFHGGKPMKAQRKAPAKDCGGVTCLPGKGGGCVACSEDD